MLLLSVYRRGFRYRPGVIKPVRSVWFGAIPSFVPDLVHAHDWQAGLTHAYLHHGGGRRPGRVMTVHNLAYQGRFSRELLEPIGLPAEAVGLHGVEYYGAIGFLKAGLQFPASVALVLMQLEICLSPIGPP
jgi:glycogen synthase